MLDFIDENKYSENVTVNKELLYKATLDYFVDIARLKDFHGIKHVQKIKIDAYMWHWILKRRPLQIINVLKMENVHINQQFVCIMLLLSCIEETHSYEEIAFSILEDFKKHLYYHLIYRLVDPQGLELMLLAFKTGINFRETLHG
jgi:hypothetical protein